MTITKNSVVTLDYRITDDTGKLLDTGNAPLIYLHGGYDNLFKPLEAALEGKTVGETFSIALTPAEAFGEYDSNLSVTEALSDLPDDIEVGMEIEGYLESSPDDVVFYIVTEITAENAVLDANHPFAGMDLVFEGRVKAIREATGDEIHKGRP
jgi:FKBP-type peptidyl-prolyl cis-trans isomerase SlyD